MIEDVNNLISEGYKIMKFERDIDIISGQEIGIIEMKALDGYRKTISVNDNEVDDIEKVLFKYLKED